MKTRSRRSTLAKWTLLTAPLVLSGCSYLRDEDKPLNTLNPQGEGARIIDDIMKPVFLVAGIVWVLSFAVIGYVVVKFRERKDQTEDPVQIHGANRLEWAWTIIPALVLTGLGIANVKGINDLEQRDADAITVEVIGQQWWWEYRYDTDGDSKPDIITANQMVIPAGRQIALRISSNDVIHSFWIPNLNGKKDAVPGRVHDWAIEADNEGLYQGTCTEFCGLSHAYMRMEVKAVSESEYADWVKNELKAPATPAAGSLEAQGQVEFASQCAQCHQINATAGRPDADYKGATHPLTADNAPNLTHLMTRNKFAGNMFDLYTDTGEPNTAEIANWLREPDKMKPAAADQNRGMPNLKLSEEQIEALVAYLVTLK